MLLSGKASDHGGDAAGGLYPLKQLGTGILLILLILLTLFNAVIVAIEAGDIVPADGRLLNSAMLTSTRQSSTPAPTCSRC